jgi:hypothetical protein
MSADTDLFQASRGWFEKFKKINGIHSAVRHGETASVNQKPAEEFVQEFSDYVKAEGFLPQQVFNCYETGLFWKISQGGHTSPKRRKYYQGTNQCNTD